MTIKCSSTSHEGREIYTAEPAIPEPSLLEVKRAIKTPSELIWAGERKLHREKRKLVALVWNKE